MRYLKVYFLIFITFSLSLSICSNALADRCSISPYPISLIQDSQKAIIMHNLEEEILILSTELKASKETQILEFIPFPSEPSIELAKNDPFKEIERLIQEEKGLEIIEGWATKGGSSEEKVPVELKLSEKIGVHDVTLIKINDISGFINWVEEFFREKNIKVSNDLSSFYKNAEDYVKRGINYFVFDYVSLKTEKRSVEPLIYRFKTDRIYYPLKTSNTIGGFGIVELIFISPGSFAQITYPELDNIFNFEYEISSSAKIYLDEIEKIYPKATEFFSKTKDTFIQMIRYTGLFDFREDLFFDPSKLDPRSYVLEREYDFFTTYTLKPVDDYIRELFNRHPYFNDVEYEVYRTIFTSRELFTSPIKLVDITLEKRIDQSLAKQFGHSIIEDFNVRNEKGYELDKYWLSRVTKGAIKEQGITIELVDRTQISDGISISRVGFNMNKTKALVYIKAKTGYLVLLELKDRTWKIAKIIKE